MYVDLYCYIKRIYNNQYIIKKIEVKHFALNQFIGTLMTLPWMPYYSYTFN